MKRNLTLLVSILLLLFATYQSKAQSNPVMKGESVTTDLQINQTKNANYYIEEGFDNAWLPSGWQVINTNSTNNWYQGNITEHPFSDIDPQSTNSARTNWIAEDSDEWLISPAIAVASNLDELTLKFYAGVSGSWLNPGATIICNITSNGGTTWTPLWNAIDYVATSADWAWYAAEINLNSYIGQNIKIAWQYVGNDGDISGLDGVKLEYVESAGGTTSLTGIVTDAFNGQVIAGATVSVAGLTATTNAQGQYSIENVPEGSITSNFMGTPTTGDAPLSVQFSDLSTLGTQTVTANANGYLQYENTQVIIVPDQENVLEISLSPELSGDGLRFVINWGAEPRDLDSHLRTPEIEGSVYHVYYPSGSQGSETTAPYATLDHDDTDGFGPETITIHQFFNGTYHYYIYKYAGTGEIIVSSAVVQIYNESGLLYTLQVPTSGTGRYWYVATVDGATKHLNIVNTIQESEPGTGLRNVVYPEKEKNTAPDRKSGITSWNWNFGDGGSATSQNPSHVYASGGVYNVSLTVSDGTNQHTFTRENYIQVEGTQGTSTLVGKVTNALDGAAIEGALVEVAGLTDYTDAQGNYSIENVPEGTLTANFMGSPQQGIGPLDVQFTNLSTNNSQLVSCSKSGFLTYNNNQVAIPVGSTVTLDISLSPEISGEGLRFVINWGAQPRDLDSHLRTPDVEGQVYHVYYPSGSQGSATEAPFATLDHDVTQGFGPETITIHQFFNGTYHYYIYKFAGEGEITVSSAVIQIYNESGLLSTLQVPTTGTGRYWYVGTIDGATKNLNIINVIQEAEPGTTMPNLEPEIPKNTVETTIDRSLSSYSWNFGDGASSVDMNPLHTYQADGNYTVALTVGDGIGTSTETKVGYIKVGTIYSINELDLESVDFYPNPAKDQVTIESKYWMNLVKIYDQSGRLVLEQSASGLTHSLNIKDYQAGLYIVQVYCKKGILTKKLTIQ